MQTQVGGSPQGKIDMHRACGVRHWSSRLGPYLHLFVVVGGECVYFNRSRVAHSTNLGMCGNCVETI